MYLNMRCPYHSQKREHIIQHKICCMPANSQIMSKYVLTKPVLFQEELKMQLNLCWPDTSLASEDTKWISICDNQTTSIPARTQNVTPLLYNPCQRGSKRTLTCVDHHIPFIGRQKMHLNFCWPNASHASVESKCISTCVDQTHPLPASIENVS